MVKTKDGKIIHSDSEIKLNANNWAMRLDEARAIKPSDWLQNWQYDAVRHSFYRFNDDTIEKGVFEGNQL